MFLIRVDHFLPPQIKRSRSTLRRSPRRRLARRRLTRLRTSTYMLQGFVCLRFSRLLFVPALSSYATSVSFGAFPVSQVVLWAVAVSGAAQVFSGVARLGSAGSSAA